MSLVGKVGRRRPRARLAMLIVYALLALGAITTLYPFLLMVSTGFKTAQDQDDNKLIPAYFSDNSALLEKYLDDKYARDKPMIASTRIGEDASSDQVKLYERFLEQLPLDYWTPGFRTPPPPGVNCRLNPIYQDWIRTRYRTIDDVNRGYIEESVSFEDVIPPAEQLERKAWVQTKDPKYQEFLEFKKTLSAEYRIPIRAERIYQLWLRSKFQGQFSQVPKEVAKTATSFEDLKLADAGPFLIQFQKEGLPDRYQAKTVEDLWHDFGGQGQLPIAAFEKTYLLSHSGQTKSEFAGRNFKWVLQYILLNSRSLWNTAVYCLLAIAAALIVNPLAAYALSRYPIRQSGQILIFLLATMAFPAEVAMIPSFLLLRDLGLLNTFWALVLPGAASGYTIFLLKGFFDSLPQELFEAGAIDGAKESTMMLRIAFPLSRPVLGYIALLTFMAAYGAFIYAFLIVQDQRMWTLTVWLYNLQLTAPKAVIMAGLTLAAIPTLVVFLLAQRVILRGIVLPGER